MYLDVCSWDYHTISFSFVKFGGKKDERSTSTIISTSKIYLNPLCHGLDKWNGCRIQSLSPSLWSQEWARSTRWTSVQCHFSASAGIRVGSAYLRHHMTPWRSHERIWKNEKMAAANAHQCLVFSHLRHERTGQQRSNNIGLHLANWNKVLAWLENDPQAHTVSGNAQHLNRFEQTSWTLVGCTPNPTRTMMSLSLTARQRCCLSWNKPCR